jgi:hypothetical protein
VGEPSVSEALIVWIGWGETRWPARDEARLAARYGSTTAADLLPRLRALHSEFYESDASNVSPDLVSMGERGAAQFRARHPELSEAAVQALGWCYTWDFK